VVDDAIGDVVAVDEVDVVMVDVVVEPKKFHRSVCSCSCST
jgi:hypothetical protein